MAPSPQVTFGSKGGRQGRSGMSRTSRARGANVFFLLLLGMVVGVVFVCGLYVGSNFMQEHNSLNRPQFHILSEGSQHLRSGGHKAIGRMLRPVAVLGDIIDSQLHRGWGHTPQPADLNGPSAGGAGYVDPGAVDEAAYGAISRQRVVEVGEMQAEHQHLRGASHPKERAPEAQPPPQPVQQESEGGGLKDKSQPQVPVLTVQSGGAAEDGHAPEMGRWPLPPRSNDGTDSINASFHAMPSTRNSYAKLTSPIDELSVTMSAWIYLDARDASNTMNTVLSNKASGCEVTPDRMGYALYVNTWETTDRQLIIEWGNDHSGCAKLGSGQSGTLIEYDTWTHVAAVLTSASASLYINGKEVATSRPIERKLQMNAGMSIGRHTDDQYPFLGKISSVAFLRQSLDALQVSKLMSTPLGDTYFRGSDVIAAVPLNDAPIKPKDPLELRDVGGHVVGRYTTELGFGGSLEGLLEGLPKEARTEVTAQMKEESDALARERRGSVKAAMERVWRAYRTHAWGKDELKPISLTGQNNWGGIGCTLIDSLDTLWLMGMKDEFYEGRDWVRDHLTFSQAGTVSVFETTIRDLGGLLSAYDLSKDQVFLDKAKDLGDRLLGAFETPSGIPLGQTNLVSRRSSNAGWTGGASVLAELGTLQVEFRYLSEKTGDPKYAQKVNRVFDLMATKHPANGLYPIYVSTSNGDLANGQITFGALGDSFYEYLLKVWLQGGRKEKEYRRMFDEAMDGMMKVLLKKSKPSGLLYVSDLEGGHNVHKMDHLVCFLPAVLALGAVTLPEEDPERSERYMTVAKGLTHTCYQMYHRHPTHLAPEYVRFVQGQDMLPGANFYILRPEAAEALFYLHEITGHPIYREWSWEIFQGIERYCRTREAYGAHPDVTNTRRTPDDRMESFFLAETLKYLYLIQDPEHPIDLQKHVFNTEAHPLTMFSAPPGRQMRPAPAAAAE